MSAAAYWILAAACAVLGITDILIYLKTGKEKRTRMHLALLLCGIGALALAALQALRLMNAF